MAFRTINCLVSLGKNGNTRLLNRCHAANGIFSIQKANLVRVLTGKEIEVEEKPWEPGMYSMWSHLIDRTDRRMNENSKVIVVEGNIATGKTEFAKNIAKEFGMKFVQDASEEELFWIPEYDLDARLANEVLPEGHKFTDLESFYTSEDPKKLGLIRMQFQIFRKKVDVYSEALLHLLTTGQGVVIEKGPFSDFVYPEILRKKGYIARNAMNHYREMFQKSLDRIWRPHVVIYLGAPVPFIQEQIKKRAIPYEVGSKILTDDYIKSIDTLYREEYLQKMMKPFSEILVYNAAKLPEQEVICDDLEKMNLDPPIMDEPLKLFQWKNDYTESFNVYRTTLQTRRKLFTFALNVSNMPVSSEYELSSAYARDVHNYLSDVRQTMAIQAEAEN